MGFSLSGVLAGAAKRGSERLKTLEEDTKKLITTEAARLGKEMEDTRKQRTKDKLDYGRAARKLRSQYDLNDSQIEAVLAGGLDGVDALNQSMQNAALRAELGGTTFDRDATLATLMPEVTAGVAGRSIEEQSAAFAAMGSPFESTFDTGVANIGNTVAAMTRSGKSPDEYIRSQLQAQTQALGGQAPAAFEGQAFGTATGYGFRPDVTSVEAILAAQKASADIKSTEAGTAATEMSTERMAQTLPFELQERQAKIKQIGADMNFTQAQTDRILKLIPSDVAINEGKVLQINKDLEKTDAIIAQMAQENEQIAANTDLLKGRVGKLAIETDILSNLGEAEMKAKIEQMSASSELSRKRSEALAAEIPFIGEKAQAEIDRITAAIGTEELTQEKLRVDIDLLNKFGAAEKQAGLDLLESKILANGSYSDLEEFQVAILAENKRLEDQLATESDAGIISELEAQIARNNDRIGASAVALADTQGFEELLNKGQAPTVFNHMIKQNLQGFNVQQEFSSLDQIISNIDEGQRPAYFAALIQTAHDFDEIYGDDRQGGRYADRKLNGINNMLEDYYNREAAGGTANTASRAIGQIDPNNLPTQVQEGSVGFIEGRDGYKEYVIYTGGKFVRVF